jgi:hypothetical protein
VLIANVVKTLIDDIGDPIDPHISEAMLFDPFDVSLGSSAKAMQAVAHLQFAL